MREQMGGKDDALLERLRTFYTDLRIKCRRFRTLKKGIGVRS